MQWLFVAVDIYTMHSGEAIYMQFPDTIAVTVMLVVINAEVDNLHAVSCSQISVDEALLGEVLHATGYLRTHHGQTFLHFKHLECNSYSKM